MKKRDLVHMTVVIALAGCASVAVGTVKTATAGQGWWVDYLGGNVEQLPYLTPSMMLIVDEGIEDQEIQNHFEERLGQPADGEFIIYELQEAYLCPNCLPCQPNGSSPDCTVPPLPMMSRRFVAIQVQPGIR